MELTGTYIFKTITNLEDTRSTYFRKLQEAIGKFAEATEIQDARVGQPLTGEGSAVNAEVRDVANSRLADEVARYLGPDFEADFGRPTGDGGLDTKADHLIYYSREHEEPRMRAGHEMQAAFEAYHAANLAIAQLRELVGRAVIMESGKGAIADLTGVELPEKMSSANYEELGDWAISYVTQVNEDVRRSRHRKPAEIPEALQPVFGTRADLLKDEQYALTIMNDMSRRMLSDYGRRDAGSYGELELPGFAANERRIQEADLNLADDGVFASPGATTLDR